MRIIGAQWTKKINIILVKCSCGRIVQQSANRWLVKCECGTIGNLGELRDEYAGLHDSLPLIDKRL